MKPHPRICKTVKWGGAAASLLLLALWIGSGWWCIKWWTPSSGTWNLEAGRIVIRNIDWNSQTPKSPGLQLFHVPFELDWSMQYDPTAWGSPLTTPIWPFAGISLLVTAFAWRLDSLARRRAANNLCSTCRYDRTGLPPHSLCPECGTAPPAPSHPTSHIPHPTFPTSPPAPSNPETTPHPHGSANQ